MTYAPFEPGIEVSGRSTWAMVDGFKPFSVLASEFLIAEGVGARGNDGFAAINPDGWYPQAAWLRAFHRIGEEVGDRVLFDIGFAIPRNAVFPEGVHGVCEAIASIDVAYHMNHRKDGRVMYDPATGEMLEGIGHYGCEPAGERRIVSVCENPYPCAFDRGILTAMAQRFAPQAHVQHDDTQPCRRRGGRSCTYVVTW